MAVEIALPSHVKTILLTGAGGFVGRELVRLLLDRFPDVSLIATDVGTPPDYGISDKNRLLCVAANLCDKNEVEQLFDGKRIQAVFALQ
jgi:nucleoside-diphosphate-sugar epimerase